MINLTKRILFIINLFVVEGVNASLTNIDDLKTTFTKIHDNSWRNIRMLDSKENIVEILIDFFKNKHTDKEKLIDIIDQVPLNFFTTREDDDFWKKEYMEDKKMKEVFLGEYNKLDNFWLHNNPRVQQLILNCRELFCFKAAFQSVSPTIFHSHFKNDDVVRALSLSGTFCKLNKILEDDGEESCEFEPLFSGMLIPGQFHNDTVYYIHSCRHGFIGEPIDQIYFIPYGIRINKNLVANFEAAFQVIDLRKNVNKKTCFTSYELLSVEKNQFGYLQEDYVMVRIKNNSEYKVNNVLHHKNLVTVLKERNKETNNLFNIENLFPGFMEQNNDFPELLGNQSVHDKNFLDSSLDKDSLHQYFAIGRPGDPKYQFNESGFAITTNLTDDIILNPNRSLSDDCDKLKPQSIGKTKQIASDFPAYPGMSGGIVLNTITHIRNGKVERIARPIGTIWGSERRFDNNNIFVGLNSFINLINNN